MNFFTIESFESYFPTFKENIRVSNAFDFLISLPHKKRKFENCSSAMHSIRIAQEIVKTQTDENIHPKESEILIALFHDILEDFSHITPHQLEKYCTDYEIEQIQLLTKQKNILYEDYIKNILESDDAKKIKKFDMLDNLKTAKGSQKAKYKKYILLL